MDAEGDAMAGTTAIDGEWRRTGWPIVVGGAAALMLLPLAAMQVTDAVDWDAADFAIFGVMLGTVGCTYLLAARMTGNGAYRAAVGVALMAAFILVWMNLAVGIIGSEDNPANLIYGGVLAVGITGAFVARFQPPGMARALTATALAQLSVVVTALIAGWGLPASGTLELMGLNGSFAALWLLSACLFRRAAWAQAPASAVP